MWTLRWMNKLIKRTTKVSFIQLKDISKLKKRFLKVIQWCFQKTHSELSKQYPKFFLKRWVLSFLSCCFYPKSFSSSSLNCTSSSFLVEILHILGFPSSQYFKNTILYIDEVLLLEIRSKSGNWCETIHLLFAPQKIKVLYYIYKLSLSLLFVPLFHATPT